jgi:mediator of RNA polymerase II transcription subunit 14
MVEAKVGVTDRAKFQLLQHTLDRDVLYDNKIGQFTLRFQPEANTGTIPLLRARMQALDRLVDIVDALGRGGKHVAPGKITLREIEFFYGDSAAAIAPGTQLGSPDETKQRPWKVRLDLAAEQGVNVILDAGNPHLRVVDYLRAAANSSTFKKLPSWLSLTLPLFEALERLHDSWNSVLARDQGNLYLFHKSLDWVTIRFALSGAKNRRMHLDIRPRDKGGNLTWHVYRPATDANANGFKGLVNSAVATWDKGIGNLLQLINESLQTLAGTPPPQQAQAQQLGQQHPQQAQAQEQQQALPPQGAAPGRFPHQLQQGQQLPYQQQQRLQQQQAQQRGGLGKNNAPVVVLD